MLNGEEEAQNQTTRTHSECKGKEIADRDIENDICQKRDYCDNANLLQTSQYANHCALCNIDNLIYGIED